jgi:hypothetical protein
VAWRRLAGRVVGRSGRAVLRVVLWLLMLPPWLLAAAARLTARGWVRGVWTAGWVLSWTAAAFAAGWAAAGGRDDDTGDGGPSWV